VRTIVRVLSLSLLVVIPISTHATTWYVRNDGGSRYNAANSPAGRCDGQHDAADPGSGTNQPCAFGDVRYLWADGSDAGSWAISGGDTVIIRGGPWRTGATNGTLTGKFNNWGCGGGVPYLCYSPSPPAGTSGQHTRFLGENYANCTNSSAETQLYGGFGQNYVWSLSNTAFVDMECIEITDHSNCVLTGSPAFPSGCQNFIPYDDYAVKGILLGQGCCIVIIPHDILLQDMNIHGLVETGIGGFVGPNITLNRVRIAFNGFAGWDFDNGDNHLNDTSASVDNEYVTMEWNGCNEEYPIVDTYPAVSCYSQSTGGFGDSWSGQDAALSSFICNYCIVRYNTKDGYLGPHTYVASHTIRNSIWYGNGGVAIKLSSQPSGSVLMQNNLIMSNCYRLAVAFTGAPANYNQYFADPCRADGAAMQFYWPVAGSIEMDNNSFVMASTKTGGDFSCGNQIATVAINNGGTGYQVNDVVYLFTNAALGDTFTVTSVSGGVVTGLSLTTGGNYFFTSGTTNQTTSGGHGTGLTVNITQAGNTCNGGPRIMRNNIFLGYTDPNNPVVAGQQIGVFCYTSCNLSFGVTHDSYWTTRTNNVYYGFTAASCSPQSNEGVACGAGDFAGETVSDPLFTNEPLQSFLQESLLDNFNFNITSSSPAKYAGVAIGGLTNDYNGLPYHSPPSDGALEFVTGGGNGLVPGRQPRL